VIPILRGEFGDGPAAVIPPFSEKKKGTLSANSWPLSLDKLGMGRLLKGRESQKTCLGILHKRSSRIRL
jgi:hypothetical protein